VKTVIAVSIILFALPMFGFCAPQEARQNRQLDVQAFWSAFRGAVLTGDKNATASLAEFPFKTRGTLDNDPVMTIDKDSFIEMLDRILDQDPGLRQEPETMRELIRRTAAVPQESIENETMFRIGLFLFKKIRGKWRFVQAYIEE
jgi:hypothetical protein